MNMLAFLFTIWFDENRIEKKINSTFHLYINKMMMIHQLFLHIYNIEKDKKSIKFWNSYINLFIYSKIINFY